MKDYYVPLKEHCDKQFENVNKQFDNVKESIKVALDSINVRLRGMNEFRDTLTDQAKRLPTREEMDAQFVSVQHQIDAINAVLISLRESRAQLEGKASQKSVNFAQIMSAMGLLLAIVSFFTSLVLKLS